MALIKDKRIQFSNILEKIQTLIQDSQLELSNEENSFYEKMILKEDANYLREFLNSLEGNEKAKFLASLNGTFRKFSNKLTNEQDILKSYQDNNQRMKKGYAEFIKDYRI
ncbi:hypothetical protein O9G_003367 [Rozella allomycis CSF55]|uniref:Uncharacterized protein n=1 Tax=Rozella allomycis (strain CSF55) TaxID=988480 RepID=A0A075B406_ROZAC|nr:hypothetical protein O9G_003367 [Rozella allomycis CSF55]|eukprot:EPZ35749.1 hypothetical protein O9G_003367 [Rozella allomycis CSF55]